MDRALEMLDIPITESLRSKIVELDQQRLNQLGSTCLDQLEQKLNNLTIFENGLNKFRSAHNSFI